MAEVGEDSYHQVQHYDSSVPGPPTLEYTWDLWKLTQSSNILDITFSKEELPVQDVYA